MNKEHARDDCQLIIEQLRAENELKTKWLSLISHDFKGMFNNILSLLAAFENEAISQELFLSMLPELKHDAEKNLKTLQSTFNWVNTQTDGFRLQREDISVYELFLQMQEELNAQTTLKSISMLFLGDKSLSLNSDRFLLSFILKQTIENAIKYSNKKGEVRVIVSSQNNVMFIEVKDDGMGMSYSMLNNISTLNGTPYKGSMEEKGAGLSLVIVKYFVEKLNAKMEISSEIEKGTTIKFSFLDKRAIQA